MELLRSDHQTIDLRLSAEELTRLYHIAMTANLVFDELDTVPYGATREGVSGSAAFLESLTEEVTDAPQRIVEMSRQMFHDLVSTVYTLDISFHAADGNPFELDQPVITDYSRRLMQVQEAVVA